jgi:flavorubredoxin
MVARKLTDSVFQLASLDWNRRLFDSLIPLPDGTTYNSYLVKGSEKTALIDTTDPSKQDVLMEDLSLLGVKKIDYVIANHAEQDHSGSIPAILARYPDAKLVASLKGVEFIQDLLLVPKERCMAVGDREKINLGGRTLEFISAPWVHWPETILTYLPEDRILFSCDLFGSHIAGSDLYVRDEAKVYEAAKRYYAEIMMPFRAMIKSHLEKLKNFDVGMIAPSHGAVYDKPGFIMNAYRDWTSDDDKNEVVIPYASMHGSTEKMVNHLAGALIQRGITVRLHDLPKTDVGELAIALVDAATIVVGTPTVSGGPHPQAVYAAFLANVIRPKARIASVIGSYVWGGRAVEVIAGMIPNLKVSILTPVMAKGHPKEGDYKALDVLADQILEKHKEFGII